MKYRTLAGIFLISLATLSLEISLTRYFSVSQQYHFSFWVVSIAFLGYGASGSFLAMFRRIGSFDRDNVLSTSALLLSLSILSSFFLCNSIPFDFIKISWDKDQIFFVFLFYFLLCLPFFFSGLTISFAIASSATLVNKIYFSDLFGAGVGTLFAAIIFLPKGDKGVIVIISLLALLASYLFSLKRSFLFKSILILFIGAEAILLIISPSWMSFRISPFKALPTALKYPKAKHLSTKWNSYSRIDVIDSPAARYAPGLSLLYEKTLPPQLGVSIDGEELTAITHYAGPHEPSPEFLSFLPSSLAYSFIRSPRTLIIEPRGGLDVLAAVFFKAPSIKVIENNPLITGLLTRDLASFSGNLYKRDDVQITSASSRAALFAENGEYDLIVFSLTDVFGSSSSGLYGFGEHYLYTLDSFQQVLDLLSPQGMVSMSLYLLPPPRQEIRVLATWIEALERDEQDPMTQIVAIRSWGTISYFIKKSPFQSDQIETLKNFSEKCLFDLVYYPGIQKEEANNHNVFEKPVYFDLTQKLLDPRSRDELYDSYLFEIEPVSDDRPFFYNFLKLTKLNLTYKALGKKWLPLLQGEFLVPLLFFQAVLIAFILILLPPIVLRKRKGPQEAILWKIFLYFGLIGTAFMFVEITLIQKFILFLGHPLYSIAIILFSLLFSAGVGSYLSKRVLGQSLEKNLRKSLFLCAGLIFLYLLLLPLFFRACLGIPLPLKILLTFLVIFPLGVLMGFPFPTGIRLLMKTDQGTIPWAWATNAFSSVVNSISALMLAFWAGYNLVLFLAAGAYLLTLPFLGFSNHGHEANA